MSINTRVAWWQLYIVYPFHLTFLIYIDIIPFVKMSVLALSKDNDFKLLHRKINFINTARIPKSISIIHLTLILCQDHEEFNDQSSYQDIIRIKM